MAIVLRDDRGQTIAGSTHPLHHLLNATTAEAYALQKGLQLIDHMGFYSVITETDSLELVHAFNGQIEIWSPYAAILADCFQRRKLIMWHTKLLGFVLIQTLPFVGTTIPLVLFYRM
jgi:ribonuclease HI